MPRSYDAKKTSYTISQAASVAAEIVAGRYASGNLSLVVDVALKHFASLPASDVEKIIAREHAERAVTGSRSAWMRAFWSWLARLNGAAGDPIDNLYAPRTWNGHTIVFLLKSATEYPGENDRFHVHTWSRDIGGNEWQFMRDASPVEAAERIHDWIHRSAAETR